MQKELLKVQNDQAEFVLNPVNQSINQSIDRMTSGPIYWVDKQISKSSNQSNQSTLH